MTGPAGLGRPAQTRVGLGLAGLIVAAWLTGHVYDVFFLRWTAAAWVIAPILVAVQTWLSVGLFIVAHDAMHGSLAPGRPRLNRAMGQLCVGLYAGFSFDRLSRAHHRHHAHPGSAEDPDFDADNPDQFWRWFFKFFRTYFGLAQISVIAAWTLIEILALHARMETVLIFWALPALLSAGQLFLFGTWLPHRHGPAPFVDAANARSNDYSWLVSLLTCFHFGYHLEHHGRPDLPWWRLPQARFGRAEPARPRAGARS
ncbi:MAG: fatty acid desaturase [Caulobacteraceae bacterium]